MHVMNKQSPTKDKYLSDTTRQIILILLMILTVMIALFLWEGRQGFSMSDEGFLWYGAQRVLAGEVPFRDFDSYDVGRYYWSAAFMRLSGDNGVITLRIAAIVFQTIALCIVFLALIRNFTKQSFIFWMLAMITLVVWMIHPHKLFDVSLPMILIASFSFLIAQPSRYRYFLTGLIIGLVAVFGRNHGLYGVIGSISVMLYLLHQRENTPPLVTAFSFWFLGIIAGYLPVLIFLAVVPGFATAFWDIIRPVILLEIKSTNIPLPVPWPWRLPFEKLTIIEILRNMTIGFTFISLLLFGIAGIAWLIRQRLRKNPVSPVLAAAILLALPYAHYAFSRADLSHLARSVSPVLIGIIAILTNQSKKIAWNGITLLCGISLFVMLPFHPGWHCCSNNQCIPMKVGGDNLKVPLRTAQHLMILNNLEKQFIPADRTFICAPFCPSAYAVLGRKSPMWDIYATGPRSTAFQEAEIQRIKAANPSLAIIDNSPLDGRDDLRFSNTHPIIDQYIRDNFKRLNEDTQNPAIYINKQE